MENMKNGFFELRGGAVDNRFCGFELLSALSTLPKFGMCREKL